MTPRIHAIGPFTSGAIVDLPEGPSRHIQVLRLQPGDAVGVFDGLGHEWHTVVEQMGRRVVTLRIGELMTGAGRELDCRVTLAFGVPANDRMDALVEKATELGVHRIQPLQCERSVLRLKGERAEAKQRHWAGIAVAASEQCGRREVPDVAAQSPLESWLQGLDAVTPNDPTPAAVKANAVTPGGTLTRWLLSLDAAAPAPSVDAWITGAAIGPSASLAVLSGPEGGLTVAEEELALEHGFVRIGLGPRVLRADTAPLAVLAWLGLALAQAAR